MNEIPIKADVLGFSAHPDDIEWSAGGLILKLVDYGYQVIIIDLTCGEMGSKGDPETRMVEAQEAARRLGIADRECLNLGDSRLFDNWRNRLAVASTIRKYQPKLILAPYLFDRHPDHSAGGQIVKNASFYARLTKLESDYLPWSINRLLYYFLHDHPQPSFITDITKYFPRKVEVMRAYKSQFYSDPDALPDSYQYFGTANYPRDIEIKGSVGKCLLDAEGDINIKQGVMGKLGGTIKAGGSIWAKFLEQVNVVADKNVFVQDGIMHCQVKRSCINSELIRRIHIATINVH